MIGYCVKSINLHIIYMLLFQDLLCPWVWIYYRGFDILNNLLTNLSLVLNIVNTTADLDIMR